MKAGAEIYARNCKFPRERFVTSVTRGKNAMPPWGDVLKPEEIEALWLYVTTGEHG